VIAVHTLPKSGLSARALIGRAIHGLIPMRPTTEFFEFTRENRLALPFGVYRSAEVQWYGTGGFTSVKNQVAWRGRNPWPSGGIDRLTASLPLPWSAPIQWTPLSGCDGTVVIETCKDIGSGFSGESYGTSFGPRGSTSRFSAHINESAWIVFDNPDAFGTGRAQWDWQANVDKYPLGRWHTFVFRAAGTTRQLWAGGVKVLEATGMSNAAWDQGSANGWHWYGSDFPGAYSSTNPSVAHGACGYWNYALTERECRVLSLGFGPLLEGMPRRVMLGSGYYDLAQLTVRARRLG
jgi:hypothetical protein